MPALSSELLQSLKRSEEILEPLKLNLWDAHCAGDFHLHIGQYRDVTIAGLERVVGIGLTVQPQSSDMTKQLFILVEDGILRRFNVPDAPSAPDPQNGFDKAIILAHDWCKTVPRPGFH